MGSVGRSRTLGLTLAGVVALSGLVALNSPVASADVVHEQFAPPLASAAYTDSAHPGRSYPGSGTDVPVGATQDAAGVLHVSRTYLTYDVSTLSGTTIQGGRLSVQETQSTDCTHRQVQLWLTADSPDAPTWNAPRKEVKLMGTFNGSLCPGVYHTFDLTNLLKATASAHRTKLSLELRNAAAIERNPSLGRRIETPTSSLGVDYDTRPITPTKLYAGDLPCRTGGPAQYVSTLGGAVLGAVVADPDTSDNVLTEDIAVWPVGHPEQAITYQTSASNGRYSEREIPATDLTDGSQYSWRVRAEDGTDVSGWSRTCSFTADGTRPSAPTVTSTDFPSSGTPPTVGVPGKVTFTANDPDVAAYQYGWFGLGTSGWTPGPDGAPQYKPFSGTGFVLPAAVGKPVTVSLVPPNVVNNLQVQAYDRAGNVSDVTYYRFNVNDTSPTITPVGKPVVGSPFVLQVAPAAGLSPVLKYGYTMNGGEEQFVTATSGKASVSVPVVADVADQVQVRSYSRNGWISSPASYVVYADTSPVVTSADYPDSVESGGIGVPGVFHFAPGPADVASYTYSFDGQNEQTVTAGTDGTASVTWTPTDSGGHFLSVSATTADGTISDVAYYSPDVA